MYDDDSDNHWISFSGLGSDFLDADDLMEMAPNRDDKSYLNNYLCPKCKASGDQGIEVTGERTEYDTSAQWIYPANGDDPYLVDQTFSFRAKLGKCRSCGMKVRWGDTSSFDGWLPLND